MKEQIPARAFLLNLNSRTIHDANSTDGRCKLGMINSGNMRTFNTFEEAKNYLPDGKKVAKPCSFCLEKDFESSLACQKREEADEKKP